MSSIRELVEPDCGGANPLMRFGGHMLRDTAYKDEGLSGRQLSGPFQGQHRSQVDIEGNQLVNEYLGQISNAPKTFQMHDLLHEMREIEGHIPHAHESRNPMHDDRAWAKEFYANTSHNNMNEIMPQQPIDHQPMLLPHRNDMLSTALNRNDTYQSLNQQFFDNIDHQNNNGIQDAASNLVSNVYDNNFNAMEQMRQSEFMRFMQNVAHDDVRIDNGQIFSNSYLDAQQELLGTQNTNSIKNNEAEDWAENFYKNKQSDIEETENYNAQFWKRLQDEWKKIAENDDNEHPWLSDMDEYYDQFKTYTFDEENPLMDIENALEKGKQFLAESDIPSAVLCFEAAVKQDPNNAEIWELLGTTQAENEKDTNAIAALRKSLEINPNNLQVLMALAISYTNENFQNHALKMLILWLKNNPKYQHLISDEVLQTATTETMATSSVRVPHFREIQELYLRAVQENPTTIDPDIQEALGVLFNLSSEYEKAVDCFKAASAARPMDAKLWNRLGASLANGNRSVEAVEAYQRALQLRPGFVRARYNVGIICINLKSYNEAIQHFLTALNQQATSLQRSQLDGLDGAVGLEGAVGMAGNKINQMSDTIWSTLRMVVSIMGRIDLQQAIDDQNLIALNAAFSMDE